jgi:peptide chain release factor 3
MSWPIGIGATFKGVYNMHKKELNLFSGNKTSIEKEVYKLDGIEDPSLSDFIGEEATEVLKEEVELIDGVYGDFNQDKYLDGKVAPVFFGSALNNFGVQELLDSFIEISPTPLGRSTESRSVEPYEEKFSGFVFKIHANIDPKHRDRIAFLRIVSGKFERNKFYLHTRHQKKIKFPNPTSFMASSKSVVDDAYPGDVIGLYDSGTFKIGDSLSEGEKLNFKGIPSFSPEIFKEIQNDEPMKSKQLDKGLRQLTDEGVAQLFVMQPGNRKIIGTVGELQFEVIQYRLKQEYGASCSFVSRNFFKACWMTSSNNNTIEDFTKRKSTNIAYDKDDNPVFLAPSHFLLAQAEEDYPEITFHKTSEFKLDE